MLLLTGLMFPLNTINIEKLFFLVCMQHESKLTHWFCIDAIEGAKSYEENNHNQFHVVARRKVPIRLT